MSCSGKTSSGSDKEEKKMKRMISNRESARRSRQKRQKHLEELINEKAALERKVHEIGQRSYSVFQCHSDMLTENKRLEEEKIKLIKELNNMSQIIDSLSAQQPNAGLSDILLSTWVQHGPTQPFSALGSFNV